jgi:predicted 2-oxoglutarate/Fe(II)-dependent dioxygenase YbiX
VRTENDEAIVSVLPDLFSVGESFLRHINWNFQNTVSDIATGHHGFWILRYDEEGSFDLHCDWDSGPNGIRPPIVATAAILLNDNFEGGETVILDSTGKEAIIEQQEPLSALVWDGFTQHKIATVTSGSRYALVIHYTGTIK